MATLPGEIASGPLSPDGAVDARYARIRNLIAIYE